MTEKNKALRSAIYKKFDSESACAEALGWKRQRLSKITNGVQEPNLKDLVALSVVLEIKVETVLGFFVNTA